MRSLQRKLHRAIEPASSKRLDRSGSSMAQPIGSETKHDSGALDDAAVSDLLEGFATYASASRPQQDADATDVKRTVERKSFVTSGSVLATMLMASALATSIMIAFAVVASSAPEVATILFVAYVVLIPVAVATVLRERAKSNQLAGDAGSGVSDAHRSAMRPQMEQRHQG